MAISTNFQTAPVQGVQNAQPAQQSAQTPAQLAAQRADQTLGQKVSATPVATQQQAPVGGSNAMRDKMTQAGMKDVATPPSDDNMRTYYSQHAPHSDLIGKGDYKAAAAAYGKDAEAAIQRGDQEAANAAMATQRQLEFTGKMGGGPVSFPPTHDQAKAHFATLKGKDSDIRNDFQTYTKEFYQHVGEDPESRAKGVKDVTYTPHKMSNGKESTAPVGAQDVRDNAQLNNRGRRVIDCEGYVQLGQDLLGSAGYTKPEVHRASDKTDPGHTGHVMLEMKDSTGQPIIVNNNNIQNERAAYGGQTPLWRRLGCDGPNDLLVTKGNTLDDATVNQMNRTNQYKPSY